MFSIIPILVLIVVFDFAVVGFLPRIFRIFPSLAEFAEDEIILECPVSRIKYDVKNDFVKFWVNNCGGHKLTLTDKYLIVKGTLLTYLVKIKLSDVKLFTVHNGFIIKYIDLTVSVNGEDNSFKIYTDDIAIWEEELSKLGMIKSDSNQAK